MSASNYLELELIDHVLGNSAYTAPTNVYLSLYTSNPDEDDSGTEVADANAYARVTVTNNLTNWPSANPKLNGTVITFPEATGSWGTVTHFAIHDSGTHGGGNLLFYGALTTSKAVTSGDTLSIPVNEISITVN